jgi:hypothetical protein
VSVGLRDRRVRLYAYRDANAAVPGGYMETQYTFTEERWARLEPPTGREKTLGERAGKEIDGVLALAAEANVDPRGAVKDVRTGDVYRILATLPRRLAHEIQLLLVRDPDAGLRLNG